MRHLFSFLKTILPGEWMGEGFARFPTIDDTGYSEQWIFTGDPDKEAIHFNQHTTYKNNTPNNGHTVFWDTGFILLNKEEKILLVSAQLNMATHQAAEFQNHLAASLKKVK